MKTVAFHTLGCKVNQYETEAITEQFIAAGYDIKAFDERADIYIINTCTVTNIADKKSRKMLARAKKLNPFGTVVAVGCYVQVAYEKLEDLPYIDVLIGNTHKNEVVSIVEKYIEGHKKISLIEDVHHDVVYEELRIERQENKTRSTIKIQDGCNQYCSYCIIPYTRGQIRSRKPSSIIEEVQQLAESGYKEIILTGIHLGSYGLDLDGIELIDLIEVLDRIPSIERIRLGSLEPNFISEELLVRLKACKSLCDHFHLSMQSGSDSVLKRMKRRYTTLEYREKVDMLRRFYDDPGITTDVIVGFPMETEEEEQETLDFVEEIGFSDLHVFKYSIREGTSAARMKPQIDGKVKQVRSQKLLAIGERSRKEYLSAYVGKDLRIILEDEIIIDGQAYLTGYTSNYIKAYLPALNLKQKHTGTSLTVTGLELFADGVLAKL